MAKKSRKRNSNRTASTKAKLRTPTKRRNISGLALEASNDYRHAQIKYVTKGSHVTVPVSIKEGVGYFGMQAPCNGYQIKIDIETTFITLAELTKAKRDTTG